VQRVNLCEYHHYRRKQLMILRRTLWKCRNISKPDVSTMGLLRRDGSWAELANA